MKEDKDLEKIKVFSSEDEKLKKLGELLSNQSSRDIIKLLIEKEMYTNEIADKLDLRVNLVIHHLKKLEDLGLLQIENKEITKKGIDHKHYRINPYFFLAPTGTEEEIQKKGTLKKIFRDGIKFAIITFAGVASWIMGSSYNFYKIPGEPSYSLDGDISSFFVAIIIIGSSLTLIWFSKKYK